MKVLQVYNQQRSAFGGEEAVVQTIQQVLEKRGHAVSMLLRSSRGSDRTFRNKVAMAVNGVYSTSAFQQMTRLLAEERPDIVHCHNVYPNLSPSVLAACRASRVPAIFHVHCHILTCPNWYHLRNGKTCERCLGGKEYWCALTNCRGSIAESAAYTIRSIVARKLGLFKDTVQAFIVVSDFLKSQLIAGGYPAERIEVVHNAVQSVGDIALDTGAEGSYVAFAGRLSPEKGVDTLVDAARLCGLPVKIAGDGPEMERLRSGASSNVEFVGRLDRSELLRFYGGSRFVVVPSRTFETFSLVAAEAMMCGRPVIASRIGALPEVVADGIRGQLFATDDVKELAEKMSCLWGDPIGRGMMSGAARKWAEAHCSESVFYERLMAVYDRAIESAERSGLRPRSVGRVEAPST